MIDWIDLRKLGSERYMEGKYLCAVVCVALVCMSGITVVALSLGIDGAVLSTVIGVFGVIIGAVAARIYEKKK